MAASQTILYTVMPRGVTLDPDPLPLSVLVSPRLTGAATLASFDDWLNWTELLKSKGLSLTIRGGGQAYTSEIDTTVLRPDLWRAIFDDKTYVEDFVFEDLSDRVVISYATRQTLSLVKSIFQIGALELALPLPDRGERQSSRLGALLDGLQVGWSTRLGRELRDELAHEQRRFEHGAAPGGIVGSVLAQPSGTATKTGADGLPDATQLPAPGSQEARDLRSGLARRFSLYHHMPPAPPLAAPDFDRVLDFHKAVSALQSYPELLRALGLVFDVEVPPSVLPASTGPTPATVSITDVEPGWSWTLAPVPRPPMQTAYLHFELGTHRIFTTAPRSGGPGAIEGLLNLDPRAFGLAQVDVDGAMHKAIIVAESIDNLAPARHPEVFDETETLPTLRSAGLALVADQRWAELLAAFQNSKVFNDALESDQPQPRPFCAEDLNRGFRLDIWDSHTAKWHSLHRRDATYGLGTRTFESLDEEGFSHLAMAQPAPGAQPEALADDLYLQEAIARWNGWSLSVPPVGKSLSRDPDPVKAVPVDDPTDPDYDPINPPVTPFPMTTSFQVRPGSLPSLRFGRRYRLRARAVDLAGNSLNHDDPIADLLANGLGAPRGTDGFAYLRYEPVVAPTIIPTDAAAISGPGSAVDRLVIRTRNTDPALDAVAADLSAARRHIVPPRVPINLAEHLGMLDDATGKLRGDTAMYDLIRDRDEGTFPTVPIPQQANPLPVVADIQASVPYLPDTLARSAALRDLPGSGSGTIGRAPTAGVGPVPYVELTDPDPRPGSATLVSFDGADDWTKAAPFRLALAEGDGAPEWDAGARVLTVHLAKAGVTLVPLSSAMTEDDLKLMGVWQWFREYVQALAEATPLRTEQEPGSPDDRIAHVIQRALEGGHWMLTPPHVLTLVHAVQQPLGRPEFVQLDVQHRLPQPGGSDSVLQGLDMAGPTAAVALDTITAWRQPAKLDAFLMGGLHVHGASTDKVDLLATWDEPVDDTAKALPTVEHHADAVDEIPLAQRSEGYLVVGAGQDVRTVGYYNPAHDLMCFVRDGDVLSANLNGRSIVRDAAPRHHFGDTKHRTVTYTARSTSRFREYFPAGEGLDFTRAGAPATVQVPASARPAAPLVRYVVPTFGWERQTATNVKRSVRLGGGLRVYLDRPWFSSGADELLGVVLYDEGFPVDRERWKPFVTQWGLDPTWETALLDTIPSSWQFPLRQAAESAVSLQEHTPVGTDGTPGRVAVAGHSVGYDAERCLWYADIVVEPSTDVYSPFIRLALARYQPYALDDAKLSRVVLADFAQLTPDRALIATADPYHPRTIRVTISGPVPNGPPPDYRNAPLPPSDDPSRPTVVTVTVQERDPRISGDLAWHDAPGGVATVNAEVDGGRFVDRDYLAKWVGSVTFQHLIDPGRYRLLVKEYEYVSASYTTIIPGGEALPLRSLAPGRLIYAEAVNIDDALVGPPPPPTTAPPPPA
jgi:hypothetical protein